MNQPSNTPLAALSPQEKVAASRNDESMFVLSGTVSTLYVTDGTVNLLKGMQGKMLAAGMGAAIQGMSGSVANSAMLAMYDGEHVQHFGCYLGEQMVIGTFESIEFKEGDQVKIVVTRLDDKVGFAHAVVRPSDGLLWMPYSISKGRWKVAQWFSIAFLLSGSFGVLLLGLFHLLDPMKDGFLSFLIEFFPYLLGTGLFICGGAFWSSLDDAKYAERIMKVLGFKNPKIVNLSPYSQARLHKGASYMVYDLRAALRAYGSLSKAKPRQPASKP